MIRSFDAFVRFDTDVVVGFEARFSPRTRRWERRTTLEWRVPQLMFASVTSRFNLKQTSDLTCSGNPEEDLRAGQASNREVAEGKREPSRKWKGASRTGPRYAHEGKCGTPSLPPSCEPISRSKILLLRAILHSPSRLISDHPPPPPRHGAVGSVLRCRRIGLFLSYPEKSLVLTGPRRRFHFADFPDWFCVEDSFWCYIR